MRPKRRLPPWSGWLKYVKAGESQAYPKLYVRFRQGDEIPPAAWPSVKKAIERVERGTVAVLNSNVLGQTVVVTLSPANPRLWTDEGMIKAAEEVCAAVPIALIQPPASDWNV